MITCRKCQAINPNEAEVCQNCEANLLPGESFKDRLGIFIFGIIGGVLSAVVLFFLSKNPELSETSECCFFTNPNVWFIAVFALERIT